MESSTEAKEKAAESSPVDTMIPVSSRNCIDRQILSFFSQVFHSLWKLWNKANVSHRGAYSVDRLVQFSKYAEETSPMRVLLVTTLTPVPALLLAVGIESIPLQSPELDWDGNTHYWIRAMLTMFIGAVGAYSQVDGLIPNFYLPYPRMLLLCIIMAVTCTAMYVATAAVWCFPTPFGSVLAVIPFNLVGTVTFIVAVGYEKITSTPGLLDGIKKQMTVLTVQANFVLIFSGFVAVFRVLSHAQQTLWVMTFPILKIAAKNAIALAASNAEDKIPEITVMSIDLFTCLSVAICMQNATSIYTVFIIITIDAVQSFGAVYQLHLSLKDYPDVPEVKSQHRSRQLTLLKEAIVLVQQPGFKAGLAASQVRMFSTLIVEWPSHLRISVGYMVRQLTSRFSIQALRKSISLGSTLHEAPAPSLQKTNRNEYIRSKRANAIVPRPAMPTSPSSKSVQSKATKPIQSKADEVNTQRVIRTLKLFFRSEFLMLVEAVECIVPVLYITYLTILSKLHNSIYYAHSKNMSNEELEQTSANLLLYSLLEFLSFLCLHFTLKHQFGCSPVYLLAFVLEKQAKQVQGKMIMWIPYILLFTVEHSGIDFSFQFVWMEKYCPST